MRHRAPGPPDLGPLLPQAIYEVNTWVWLGEVAARSGLDPSAVTLADVPSAEWDALVPDGIDCVWLMGLWERSPAGRAVALADPQLRRSWDAALQGWTEADVLGSPYCVRDYVCDPVLGGTAGLAAARAALHERGARLLVDLVPNHVAPDHPLVAERPEAFVRGTVDDRERDPAGFLDVGGGTVLARARDPYFPPWPDVVQLDAFAPAARTFLASTLRAIAEQADGVRCDMAMLLLDDVFAATWGERVGPPLPRPAWVEVLAAVRLDHPGFVAVAEAYWGREPDLLAQGFDACYDKTLYDRLVGGSAREVVAHLRGMAAANARTVRFLENHDEPRAAASLQPPARRRAAAVVLAGLPGATLWHEGQLDSRTVRLPVFLGRRPDEPVDEAARDFLLRLVGAAPELRGAGEWSSLDVAGWPDNDSGRNLVAYGWFGTDAVSLVVVNLSDAPAQGLVRVASTRAPVTGELRFVDILTDEAYERNAADLTGAGLFVDLPAWGCHAWLARGLADGVEEAGNRPDATGVGGA